MKRLLLLLVALALVFAVGNAYIINLMVVTALFTLPALGLSLLMGYTGQISLGHAAFIGIGAYASAILSMRLAISPWLAVIAATALSAFVSWLLGWLVFRLRGHHLAMATLGLGIIVQVIMIEWRPLTGGQDGLASIPSLVFAGVSLASDRAFYILAWVACLAGLVLASNIVRSPFGLTMRVVAENELVAGSIGIVSNRLKRQIMMIGGAYAGLAGALYAHWLGYISPSAFDVGFSIRLLLMVALGGFSGIYSVLFGVFFLVVISELLKPFERYDVVVYGLLLVGVMIYCPRGLLLGGTDAWRRMRLGRRAGSEPRL